MIKGWRNDPAWVVYAEKKQEAKIHRQIERVQRNRRAIAEMQKALALHSNQRMNHGFSAALANAGY